MNRDYIELCWKLSRGNHYVKEQSNPGKGWVREIAARDPIGNVTVIEKVSCNGPSAPGGPYLPKGLPVIGGRATLWGPQMPPSNLERCMDYGDLPGRKPQPQEGKT